MAAARSQPNRNRRISSSRVQEPRHGVPFRPHCCLSPAAHRRCTAQGHASASARACIGSQLRVHSSVTGNGGTSPSICASRRAERGRGVEDVDLVKLAPCVGPASNFIDGAIAVQRMESGIGVLSDVRTVLGKLCDHLKERRWQQQKQNSSLPLQNSLI
jgi:hypothetical protein